MTYQRNPFQLLNVILKNKERWGKKTNEIRSAMYGSMGRHGAIDRNSALKFKSCHKILRNSGYSR